MRFDRPAVGLAHITRSLRRPSSIPAQIKMRSLPRRARDPTVQGGQGSHGPIGCGIPCMSVRGTSDMGKQPPPRQEAAEVTAGERSVRSAGGIPTPEAGNEITESAESCASCRDLAGSCRRSLAWWGPAVLLLAVTASAGWWWHVAGWSLGLAWIGGLCLVNAARCGRVHCRFTGPFALAMALFVLAVGWRLIPVGRHPWHPITWTFIIGWCVLYYVPEWIWGRYATQRRSHREVGGKP